MAWLGLFAGPAKGQIASYVDEHGKQVYINADDRASRHGPRRAAVAPARMNMQRAFLQGYPKDGLERMVQEAAERHRVDPALVRAVIETESGWNPSAVSRKGARGLMQLAPGTAQRFGVVNVFDPKENLEGGVRYLRALLERYNGDLDKALAAYNAGEGAVDRARGVPNYPETLHYVRKITDSYFRPGFGRSRSIYRATDERGRLIFTNE
ncbi:MAG TPA: lytic transglycosylase domain-containing protein [Candidatus Acidoferrales bacterium]|nr:lytic transglycosylase domain-containing protein [Candidatus Acidoferrales bacterium]